MADVETIRAGYAFEGAALEMGGLVNGEAMPSDGAVSDEH